MPDYLKFTRGAQAKRVCVETYCRELFFVATECATGGRFNYNQLPRFSEDAATATAAADLSLNECLKLGSGLHNYTKSALKGWGYGHYGAC